MPGSEMRWRRAVRLLGARTLAWPRGAVELAALEWEALRRAIRPRTWSRAVRRVFVRQVFFTGVEAVPFTLIVAFLVGISVVVQVQLWLQVVGQGRLLGSVLGVVLVREVAPVLTNIVVIGRSGTAMATEIASMKIGGELRLLEELGIHPIAYVVVPRVFAAGVSTLALTVLFLPVCLLSGYLVGLALGAPAIGPTLFLRSVSDSLDSVDVASCAIKSLVPGFLTAGLCVLEGLKVADSPSQVPRAATRGVVRSVTALLLTSAVVSVWTYL